MRTFHDSVIVAIQVGSRRVDIRVEDVANYDRETCIHEAGSLQISGLNRFEENSQPADIGSFMAGFDDGQILELSIKDGVLEMLVVWENYSEKRSCTTRYRFEAEQVIWNPEVFRIE